MHQALVGDTEQQLALFIIDIAIPTSARALIQ